MRARVLEALIIGAAILAVPVGYWAGPSSAPPEVRDLFERFMKRLTAFR